MKKPTIGIIPLVDIGRESYWMLPGYMEGIIEAGGLPVMLPLTSDQELLKQLAEEYDAFLFTGGHDLEPVLYGEENGGLCGELCPQRDKMEGILFPLIYESDKPALGICRGLQFFNVALGGTLYQDIPQQFPTTVNHHQDPPYDQPIHEVALTGGTPLQTILGCGSIGVNSCHHQGIKDLAPGLKAMAHAADGLVEAVYAPDKKCIWAVQWHPEFSHQVDQNSRRLFKAFVDVVVDGAAHSPVRNRSLMSS